MKNLDFDSVVAIRVVNGLSVDGRMDYSYWSVEVLTDDDYDWHFVCACDSKAEALLSAGALKFENGREDVLIYR